MWYFDEKEKYFMRNANGRETETNNNKQNRKTKCRSRTLLAFSVCWFGFFLGDFDSFVGKLSNFDFPR